MAAPVVNINDHTLNFNEWAQIKNWLSYSDADGNAAVKYQFWDAGTGANSGYFWTSDNAHWAATTTVEVNASDLAKVWVRGGTDNGSESMWVRAFDGTQWSNWDIFTLTTHDDPPSVSVSDHTLNMGQWAQMQNWISYSDSNGDAPTKYQFWDSGVGAGTATASYWTPNGYVAPNTTLEVSASDLSSVWVQGGTANGTDSLWVRAFDGHVWSNWDIFTLTTHNDPPTVSVADHTVNWNEWAQVKYWISYSDSNGDAPTKYQFWDAGTGADSGYFWTPDNTHWAANTTIEVNASDLANAWVRGGTDNGSDSMWVRAFDGHEWSNWDVFTLTTHNTPPVATISPYVLHFNEWAQVKDRLAYSDADGDAAVKYQFMDNGASSGYLWTPGNTHVAPNTTIEVAASDLANVWVRGGTDYSSQTMWVRGFDGKESSSWDGFTVMTDDGPIITPTSASTKSFANQSFAAGSLFTYSDPFGGAAQYDFWNSGGGGGHFMLGGAALPANQDNIISAGQLGQLSYVVGTGIDTLWVKANDGRVWGAWSSSFTMSDPPAVAAGETITLGSAYAGEVNFLGDTGTLKLEDSSSFAGTVAGLHGKDAIDLADIGFGASSTLGYSGNADNSGGTLSVGDGTHMANIALLGSYMASSFVAASNGHGGTLISEATQSATQVPLVTQPHA